jgi:DNA-3-methyladenine glycosylase II
VWPISEVFAPARATINFIYNQGQKPMGCWAKSSFPEEILKDKKLAKWVREHGFIDDKDWRGRRIPFHSLIRSIIYQQISGKAAASILKKFKNSLAINSLPRSKSLRCPKKTALCGTIELESYLYPRLAEKFTDGTIEPRKFPKYDERRDHRTSHARQRHRRMDRAHVPALYLARPDILPTLDLAIRKGFQVVYGLKNLPSTKRWKNLRVDGANMLPSPLSTFGTSTRTEKSTKATPPKERAPRNFCRLRTTVP